MLEDRIPAAFAEESFIAHEHVNRTQLAGLQFRKKTASLGKAAHQ